MSAARKGIDRDWFVEIAQCPAYAGREAIVFRVGSDRALNDLSLVAFPVRRNDEAASYRVCNRRPEIFANQMHTQIDARSAAGTCEDVAILHIERRGINLH